MLIASSAGSLVSSLTQSLLTHCSGTLVESMGGTVRVTTSTLGLLATSLGYPALGATLSTAGVIASTLLSSTVRVPIPSLVALSSSVTGGLACIAVRALGRALSLGVEVSSRALKGYRGRQRGFGQWAEGVNYRLDALELVNEHRGVMESVGGRTSDMLHSTPLPPLSSGATCSTLCDALGSERQEDCQWVSIASSPPSGEGGVDEPSSKAPPLRAPPPPFLPCEDGRWLLVPHPPTLSPS